MEYSIKEQIFIEGEQHFASLLNDIRQSKERVDLETYTFANDFLGREIAIALVEAAKRGVLVRVIVDGAGTPRWSTTFAYMLESAGVETKVFHPFPWQLWEIGHSTAKLPILLKLSYLLLKVNARDHRKVCMIDNEIAYVGSFNINKCHLNQSQGGDSWRDTSVRLSGVYLRDLKKAFNIAWHSRTIQERLRDSFRQVRRGSTIRLNYTRHRRRILYKDLLRRISQCKKRIWITNAYFVPENFLLRRLKEAAERHIDVRVLLAKKSDVMMMPWASSTFYFSLLKAGVKIFEYMPSVLHAKTLILDDWMLVGTSNLNYRSLLHDLEADIMITVQEAKTVLEQQFLKDIRVSREISWVSWKRFRPAYQRLLGRLVLYMKYWI